MTGDKLEAGVGEDNVRGIGAAGNLAAVGAVTESLSKFSCSTLCTELAISDLHGWVALDGDADLAAEAASFRHLDFERLWIFRGRNWYQLNPSAVFALSAVLDEAEATVPSYTRCAVPHQGNDELEAGSFCQPASLATLTRRRCLFWRVYSATTGVSGASIWNVKAHCL